jgi:serine/threonine-protein kinase
VLHTVVSRLHCRLHYAEDGWVVTDLDSRNGTWVDATKIDSRKLEDGDVFTLGKRIAVRFHILEQTGEIEATTTEDSTCAFCMGALAAGDGVRDSEGNSYHGPCRSLANLVGTELGGVRIIERLSGGVSGHLLRAHQPSLNRHVLLHAFDESTVSTGQFRDRLLDEVRAVSRLLHPNLLQIHDLIDHKGLVLVVMEYLTGSTLEDVLEKQRFVKVPTALSIASQISDALGYAREQGVVLRWITPGEIRLNEQNEAKLNLFHPPVRGRPKPADLAYVAPEVVSGGGLRAGTPRAGKDEAPVALRSAVYSVGAILYHMLAGIPPFEGDTEEQILPKIMKTTPPALRRVNLKVSPALARIVERSMDKEPGNRPPDFRSFRNDLRKIIAPGL